MGGQQTDAASDRLLYRKLKVTAPIKASPKVYIRAPLFKMPAFDGFLEQCRADRSWKTETVTCGHDVMIDQPEVCGCPIQASLGWVKSSF